MFPGNILRLARFPNLVIIAATQFLTWFFLIKQLVPSEQIQLIFGWMDISILMLSTVLIAAGGYVLNDYFDQETDRVNKPEKIIIGRSINQETAWKLYVVSTIAGVATGLYLAFKHDNWNLGMITAFCAGLLWFYNSEYKKQVFIGNFIIAVLAALVPVMPGLYAHFDQLQNANTIFFDLKIILGYAAFAFVTTFIREIIKDMEDMEGDRKNGGKTLPLALGTRVSKLLTGFLIIATIAGIGIIQYFAIEEQQWMILFYSTLLIQLPLLVVFWKLFNSYLPVQYHSLSLYMKVVMLAGIFSMVFLPVEQLRIYFNNL